jgi:DNA-3-methyladenine glycosylase II
LSPDELTSAIDQIAVVDTDVSRVLGDTGYPKPRNRAAGFHAFVSTVVSQQLSTKAANTIFKRVCVAVPELSPEGLLRASVEDLRGAGLSARKVEYLQGLAKATLSGEFDPDALESMDDQQAIRSIVRLRGFGVWTAKIYLMFSLGRKDIFPEDDLALVVALQHLKGLESRPKPSAALELTRTWSPNRSAGSLFLWKYYSCNVRPASSGI